MLAKPVSLEIGKCVSSCQVKNSGKITFLLQYVFGSAFPDPTVQTHFLWFCFHFSARCTENQFSPRSQLTHEHFVLEASTQLSFPALPWTAGCLAIKNPCLLQCPKHSGPRAGCTFVSPFCSLLLRALMQLVSLLCSHVPCLFMIPLYKEICHAVVV